MLKYCLEIRADDAVIHNLDCREYDLGTLLGLGCVVDLGEFPSVARVLEATRISHPAAIRCAQCCPADIMYLPQVPQASSQKGIILLRG
ncbi:MAG: hypothetical protein RLZZ227_2889 [Pseudomonadota bacterium]|jgi:hypothetical protein